MRCARCGVDLGRSPGLFCPKCGLPVHLNLSRENQGALLGASTNPEYDYVPANTDQALAAMSQAPVGRSTGAMKVPPGGSTAERPTLPADSGWAPAPSYPNDGSFTPGSGTPAYRFDAAPTVPISPPMWGAQPPPRDPHKPQTSMKAALIVAIVLFVLSGLAVTSYVVFNATGNRAAHVTTPKPTAIPNEKVVVQDSLATNTLGWPKTDHCFFQGGSFHIKDNRYCYAGKPYTDARITIQATQLSGPTTAPYGIVFRVTSLSDFYGFEVAGNGSWFIWKCANGTCTKIVPTTQTTKMQSTIGEVNTLSVLMQASHFEFFINGEKVGTVDDDGYTTGYVGLEAGKDIEVAFSNLSIAVPQA